MTRVDFADRLCFAMIHRQAVRKVLQAERTRQLWADPLALFPPDPQRLAIVQYNDGLRERSADIRALMTDLRDRVTELRTSEGQR